MKYIIIIVLSVLCIVISGAFLSNKILTVLFKDKVWAHRVNSLEKLNKANRIFSGVELDVVFHADNNYFDVNHPPDTSTGLSLSEYFHSQVQQSNYRYWIDYKNLSEENALQSSNVLDSITRLYNMSKNNLIVESGNPRFLKSFREKGFLTSYYLPPGLHNLSKSSLEIEIGKIKDQLNQAENFYISSDYQDYPIMIKYFPDNKKLFWFTLYGPMNKLKARMLLYKILFDKNVDVLLIPFHVQNTNNTLQKDIKFVK